MPVTYIVGTYHGLRPLSEYEASHRLVFSCLKPSDQVKPPRASLSVTNIYYKDRTDVERLRYADK